MGKHSIYQLWHSVLPEYWRWLCTPVLGINAYGFQRAPNKNAWPPCEMMDSQVQAYLGLPHHTMVPPGHDLLIWRAWAPTCLSEAWFNSLLPPASLATDTTILCCSPYPLISTSDRCPSICHCIGEQPQWSILSPMLLRFWKLDEV